MDAASYAPSPAGSCHKRAAREAAADAAARPGILLLPDLWSFTRCKRVGGAVQPGRRHGNERRSVARNKGELGLADQAEIEPALESGASGEVQGSIEVERNGTAEVPEDASAQHPLRPSTTNDKLGSPADGG